MRPPTKKQRVLDFAVARGWAEIGEAEWHELRTALPDVSESTIRESGLAIAPPWCGVRQHSLEELETALGGFATVYAERPDLHRYCREQVIAAKDHARLASLSPRVDGAKRALKTEMVTWMLVWLDDPAMFTEWVGLRLIKLDRAKLDDCSST